MKSLNALDATAHNSLEIESLRVSHQRDGAFSVEVPQLQVAGGAVHGLIGRNGSGKTTLALALAGIVPHLIPGVVQGSIRIGGTEVTSLPLRERLGKVGYSFQDAEAQILFGTVRDVLSDDDGINPKLGKAISALGADHLLDRLPNELSGGEAQRVALLTALRRDPSVVIFDEAVSALDPQARHDFSMFVEASRTDGRVMLLLGQRVDSLAPYCGTMSALVAGRHVSASELNRGASAGVSLDDLSVGWEADKSRCAPEIRVTDLSFRRGELGGFSLGPVSLKLAPGEIVALLGPNGCGKTSLLLALAGFLKAQRGEFASGDDRFSAKKWQSLPPPATLVTQSPLGSIIGGSVGEDLEIQLGLKRSQFQSPGWEKLLVQFDYLDFERDPLELSYGQQRFLTMLEAFLSWQPLLLLDEPELGLDEPALAQIGEWVRDIKSSRSRSVVFVTHDLRFAAELADRCILMKNGCCIAETVPRSARELQDWYLSSLKK